MTTLERKTPQLAVSDLVKHYDDGTDGYPIKWVEGTVTEVGDESFCVMWDDFKKDDIDTEYRWDEVTITGDQIISNTNRKWIEVNKEIAKNRNTMKIYFFTREDLVSFGNYLLSDERVNNKMIHPDFIQEQKEQSLKEVSHADVLNWFSTQTVELAED